MRDSLPLGRVAGIRIGLNWSVAALLVLLVWILATQVFPAYVPAEQGVVHLAMAGVAALLFFVSILLHELGHALQARRDGMQIDGITLWLFGGVARFTGGFPSAGAELRIAAAGPAVSLVLGGAFIGLGFVPGLPDTVGAVAAWLGYINVALLVFNLLPALPLDGGRMLRALMWHRRGDFASATRTAAAVARVIAYGLIALGAVVAVVSRDILSGLWLAFIAWFLLEATRAEARAATTRGALDGVRVSDAMSPDPITTAPEVTLERFVEECVWGRRHAAYPVVADGAVVGLIPTRRLAEVARERWSEVRVAELTLPRAAVPVLAPNDTLVAAHDRLAGAGPGHGHALVLDGERLVGLLTPTDLARALTLRGMRVVARPSSG